LVEEENVRLLFIFLGVFAIAMAEERPLQPINRPVILGEVRCPQFFVLTTFNGHAAEQIIFSYKASDGSAVGDAVPKARTLVRINEGQAPTYEKTSVDGQSGVLFRLSQAEYENARACLPKPQAAQ
jgi:hypothetical protein